MAATIPIGIYSDALVVLATAGIVVPLVRRSGISPVLGYLGAGALLGPLGLGTFTPDVPLLYWFTITDRANVTGIADLGIVFLLFLIGLELSFARLLALRRLLLGLGALQVLVTTTLIAGLLHFLGQSVQAALLIGACLALSSTAIVIEIFSAQNRIGSTSGRASFAILLAQDLAMIPILLLVSALSLGKGGGIFGGVFLALGQAALALVVIVVLGRVLLRPLFRLVASVHSDELFLAAILFVIVATSVLAAVAGMSMALGAFVAGLLLAETEYRKAVEAIIEPFKALLLGIFFFTVGMNIDIRELLQAPLLLAAAVLALIILKSVIIFTVGRIFGVPKLAAFETALLLAPGGEFAFVGIGAAVAVKLVDERAASFALAVTSVSMVLIPLLATVARRVKIRLTPPSPHDAVLQLQPAQLQRHAIVVGHGRVGKVVCAMLKTHKISYVATDRDPASVNRDRLAGHDVYYGNASDPAFLKACGLMDADALIITIHTPKMIDEVVRVARALRADVSIISRARDAAHARHLYAIGVNDAVPETIEASLQLSEAALVGLNVPMGKVLASIHDKRDEFRHDLQSAARAAGQDGSHGVKAKEGGST